MLSLLFIILFFAVFGKMVSFAFKATWSIFKVVMYLVFLPMIIIGFVIGGFIYIAIPILIIIGIASLFAKA
ncbi:hypothetical protein [Butyrivibrio sp. INlla14]|uniref:hypothetical protein n=1 Tax=Butyrivibrio sp. INlla14 TaxID=1520808 RepID=UPI000876C7A7|nr:hypothetical protein [Butyrivibrio sp. INlla14]SCY08313.1 hypothetical protein SAMN02910371_00963 [Butyrivibrio sp. INlla14]